MTYAITRIRGEPIISIELDSLFVSDSIEYLMESLADHLAQITVGCACILDLSTLQDPLAHESHVMDITQAISRLGVQPQPLIGVIVAPADHDAANNRWQHIPVFSHLGDAHSYLSLKISRQQVEASLSIRQTQSLNAVSITQDEQETSGTGTFPNTHLLRLYAPDQDKEMLIRIEDEATILVMGRRESDTKAPEIDLSLWAGYHSGVSRRHAQLRLDGDHLQLIDLASVNGTFLNGERLLPDHPYTVHDNDEIVLGKLRLLIQFEK